MNFTGTRHALALERLEFVPGNGETAKVQDADRPFLREATGTSSFVIIARARIQKKKKKTRHIYGSLGILAWVQGREHIHTQTRVHDVF